MKLRRTQYHQGRAAVIRQAEAQAAADNILYVGFCLTLVWTLIKYLFGNPTINLYWIPDVENPVGYIQVSLAYLFWIIAINIYIGILWHDKFLSTSNEMYRFIACCYYFAVIEMFAVWDNPWFYLLGIPMASNTLIIFGFFFSYADKRWNLLTS